MTVLKKLLAEGGAGQDRSHGSDTAYDVLKSMALESRPLLSTRLPTIATGVLAELINKGKRKLTAFKARVAVCGSAGSTVVELRVNTVVVGTLTFANTDPDPSTKEVAVNTVLADGDLVDINVSTAPTGGTGLVATGYERFGSIDVEGETVP